MQCWSKLHSIRCKIYGSYSCVVGKNHGIDDGNAFYRNSSFGLQRRGSSSTLRQKRMQPRLWIFIFVSNLKRFCRRFNVRVERYITTGATYFWYISAQYVSETAISPMFGWNTFISSDNLCGIAHLAGIWSRRCLLRRLLVYGYQSHVGGACKFVQSNSTWERYVLEGTPFIWGIQTATKRLNVWQESN